MDAPGIMKNIVAFANANRGGTKLGVLSKGDLSNIKLATGARGIDEEIKQAYNLGVAAVGNERGLSQEQLNAKAKQQQENSLAYKANKAGAEKEALIGAKSTLVAAGTAGLLAFAVTAPLKATLSLIDLAVRAVSFNTIKSNMRNVVGVGASTKWATLGTGALMAGAGVLGAAKAGSQTSKRDKALAEAQMKGMQDANAMGGSVAVSNAQAARQPQADVVQATPPSATNDAAIVAGGAAAVAASTSAVPNTTTPQAPSVVDRSIDERRAEANARKAAQSAATTPQASTPVTNDSLAKPATPEPVVAKGNNIESPANNMYAALDARDAKPLPVDNGMYKALEALKNAGGATSANISAGVTASLDQNTVANVQPKVEPAKSASV